MNVSRRQFVHQTAFGAAVLTVLGCHRDGDPAAALAHAAKIRIGGCDWSFGKEGDVESFSLAKAAGLDGVEISCGKGTDHLPISEPERQKGFVEAAGQSGLPIASTCLEILPARERARGRY